MNYLGLGVVSRAGARFVSSFKDLYNDLNGANLTGAVDVIAIKQVNGTIKATPFHVRFGKWGVFRTGDLRKEIEIEVNGEQVDNKMMLIESGMAFFVTPNTSATTSCSEGHPLFDAHASATNETQSCDNQVTSNGESCDDSEVASNVELCDTTTADTNMVTKDKVQVKNEVIDFSKGKQEIGNDLSLSCQPSEIEPSHSNSKFYTPTDEVDGFNWSISNSGIPTERDTGILSDSVLETETKFYVPSDQGTGLSDSEIDRLHKSGTSFSTQGEITRALSTAEEGRQSEIEENSLWNRLAGILRKKRRRYSSIEDGIYLDELNQGDYDEMAQYFPHISHTSPSESSDQLTSGVGSSPSPSLSPSHDEPSTNETDKIMSLLSNISLSRCGGLEMGVSDKAFLRSQISFEEFCANPELMSQPDLVVRMNNKYYKWHVAGPMIMSCLVFGQSLPDAAQTNLTKPYLPKKPSRFWNFWSRSNSNELESIRQNTAGEVQLPSNTSEGPLPLEAQPLLWQLDNVSSDEGLTDEETNTNTTSRSRQRSFRRKKYNFTTELSSEELSKWPLKMGKNDVVFSITTKYQGTARAYCSIYLWDCTDKLVISDFDGTITRSDVAGQVLPLIGKDWTQNGVIELFSAINNNGYRFVYLSARAIGQSWYTKNYLRSTCSGGHHLPDGPLLVTPFSLYTAFKKEVIERKPEEFKIFCLQQIRSFFPEDYNPFHAGFGNKHSDVKSYQQVNIPPSRIFTVNHKGEIKNHLSWTFQSSYQGLVELVDAQFPSLYPLKKTLTDTNFDKKLEQSFSQSSHEQYSSFVYWQQSFNNFDEVDLPSLD